MYCPRVAVWQSEALLEAPAPGREVEDAPARSQVQG